MRRVTRLLVVLTTRHDTCELPDNEIITSPRYPHDVGRLPALAAPGVSPGSMCGTGVSLGGDSFPSRLATVHDGPLAAIERIRSGTVRTSSSYRDGTCAAANYWRWRWPGPD